MSNNRRYLEIGNMIQQGIKDFRGKDLSNLELSGIDLTSANLSGANLSGANLSGAVLQISNLSGANLSGANLSGSYLISADLTDANLTGATIIYSYLSGATLIRAKLKDADLTNSFINEANLTGANLSGADLTSANFSGANLTGANLTGANFTRTVLIETTMNNQVKNKPELANAIFSTNNINNSNLYSNNNSNNTIILPKKIYDGNNRNNKTCKSYKKLFEYINTFDLTEKPIFQFEGQIGIDAGGLTRDVFDKYLSEFSRIYFKKIIKDGNEFVILKDLNENKKNELIQLTKKLILLSKWAETKILLPIDDKLLKILLNQNPLNEFSTNNINNFFKTNFGNKRSKEYLNILGSNFSNLLLQNNKNNKNKIINWNNRLSNEQKQEIMLRIYLLDCGFTSYKQFILMGNWLKTYWKNRNFTNKISFSLTEFSKRIQIIRIENRYQFNFNSNSNNKNKLIDEYPNLKLLVDYIKKSDENRKKFNKWATGSEISNDIIKIYVHQPDKRSNGNLPFIVHTCSRDIDVYKTDYKLNNTKLNAQVNADISSSNYGVA